MLRRSSSLPGHLAQRATAVVGQAEATVRFFRFPSDANAFAAAERAQAQRQEQRQAVSSLKELRHPRREDFLRLLRLLGDCSEELSQAVAEANRFEVKADGGLLRMSQDISRSLAELSAAIAVFEKSGRCQEHLLGAKRNADQIERRRRLTKLRWPESPGVVAGLRSATVARRFSQAAEAVSSAADVLGELLAVEQR